MKKKPLGLAYRKMPQEIKEIVELCFERDTNRVKRSRKMTDVHDVIETTHSSVHTDKNMCILYSYYSLLHSSNRGKWVYPNVKFVNNQFILNDTKETNAVAQVIA
jgi:hypothetical protein